MVSGPTISSSWWVRRAAPRLGLTHPTEDPPGSPAWSGYDPRMPPTPGPSRPSRSSKPRRQGDAAPSAADPLERLRKWRTPATPDQSLHFLQDQFQREVVRPHKQLAVIITAWETLVPPALARRTRLDSLTRGVLKVGVDSSSTLYELDRLLRQSLLSQLIAACPRTALQRVQLHLDGSLLGKQE